MAATATATAETVIIEVDTLEPIVVPTESPLRAHPDESEQTATEFSGEVVGAVPRASRSWWQWLLGTVGVLVLVGLVGSAFVHLPYYAFAPGSATGTENLLTVSGAPVYPAKGSVLYTTVTVRHDTVLQYLVDQLDDHITIVSERDYLGDQTPSQNNQVNLHLMDVSKEAAVYVALKRLGYDIPATGGGAVVTQISAGVPAASLLKPADVITGIDGHAIVMPDDIGPILAGKQPGDSVTLTVQRPPASGSGPSTTLQSSVVLAKREDGKAMIGIIAGAPDTLKFQYPIKVDISTGSVGGPSAGLAFTLGILDALTPGELTGGVKVAVTGTIDLEGRVGPIGGVEQKTIAAEHAGAQVFIVPRNEFDEASKVAGSRLRVVAVDTLDDALNVLAGLGGNALQLGTPGKAAA